MTLPTPTVFAALVTALGGELQRASDEMVAAFAAGEHEPATQAWFPWVRERVTRDQAAALLGVTPPTVTEYTRRARAQPGPGAFPLPDKDGTWETGRLALWKALRASRRLARPRWAGHSAYAASVRDAIAAGTPVTVYARQQGITYRLAAALYREHGVPAPPSDTDLRKMIRRLTAARDGRPVRLADVLEAARDAGHTLGPRRAARLLEDCGGPVLGKMDPDHEAGWVRPVTLAAAAGVSRAAISRALAEGRLTIAARDRWGPLLDPAAIRAGTGHTRAPVDLEPGGERWVGDAGNTALLPVVRRLLAGAGDQAVTVGQVQAALAAEGHEVDARRAAVVLYLA